MLLCSQQFQIFFQNFLLLIFAAQMIYFGTIYIIILSLLRQCTGESHSTLDLWMSFPSRTKLTANPDSEMIAWVETVRGRSDVYAYSEIGGAQRITNFQDEETENMEITDLFVDNRYVYFSRAPIANSNALGLVRGSSSRKSYRASYEEGTEVIDSVRDRQIVDVRNDRIYSVESKSFYETDISNNDTTRLLFTVSKGVLIDFAFRSPGKEGDIAFVNDRGTHAFLGLFSRDKNRIQWIRPSADSASQPTFSSDGRYLAWLSTYPSNEDITAYSASDGNEGNKGPYYRVLLGEFASDNTFKYRGEQYRDESVGLSSFGYGNRRLIVRKDSSVLFGVEDF